MRQPVRATLRGCAAVEATLGQLYAWRKSPGLLAGRPLAGSLLRHADEQTLTALRVLQMIVGETADGTDWASWGILASGSFFGLSSQAEASLRFTAEGAWGISPNLIPHHSLHALSGSLSLALAAHGPNFGVGGGPDATAEVLLSAATLLSEHRLPGLLVVVTGFATEFIPRLEQHQPGIDQGMRAVALAIESAGSAAWGACTWHVAPRWHRYAPLDLITLPDLIETIEQNRSAASWHLGAGIRFDMVRARRQAA